jgi:hypothetical protein
MSVTAVMMNCITEKSGQTMTPLAASPGFLDRGGG